MLDFDSNKAFENFKVIDAMCTIQYYKKCERTIFSRLCQILGCTIFHEENERNRKIHFISRTTSKIAFMFTCFNSKDKEKVCINLPLKQTSGFFTYLLF